MPNTSDRHRDRCCNRYKNLDLTGHRSKDLRLIPKNLKRKFLDVPDDAKILSIAEGPIMEVVM